MGKTAALSTKLYRKCWDLRTDMLLTAVELAREGHNHAAKVLRETADDILKGNITLSYKERHSDEL